MRSAASALVIEHQVDVLEDALDRVALHVARGDEVLLAVEADLEDETRVAQREGELVVGQRDVLQLRALAVDDSGHTARAAGAAGRALAEVRPVLGGDADLGHVLLLVRRLGARAREVAPGPCCWVRRAGARAAMVRGSGCRASRRGGRRLGMDAGARSTARSASITTRSGPFARPAAHPRRGAS